MVALMNGFTEHIQTKGLNDDRQPVDCLCVVCEKPMDPTSPAHDDIYAKLFPDLSVKALRKKRKALKGKYQDGEAQYVASHHNSCYGELF